MSSFEPWPLVPGDAAFEPRRLREGDRTFQPDPTSATPAVPPVDSSAAPERPPQPPEPTAEDLHRQAFEEGREAGRAELPWQDAQALRAARTALEVSIEALARTRRANLSAQRGAVVDLALAVAERLVRRELAIDPEALMGVVERALSQLEGEEPAVVALSERDLETLGGDGEQALSRLSDRGVRIEMDPTLSPGDTRVRAGALQVDTRLEEVLAALRNELAPELASPAEAVDDDGAVDNAEEEA